MGGSRQAPLQVSDGRAPRLSRRARMENWERKCRAGDSTLRGPALQTRCTRNSAWIYLFPDSTNARAFVRFESGGEGRRKTIQPDPVNAVHKGAGKGGRGGREGVKEEKTRDGPGYEASPDGKTGGRDPPPTGDSTRFVCRGTARKAARPPCSEEQTHMKPRMDPTVIRSRGPGTTQPRTSWTASCGGREPPQPSVDVIKM